MGFIKSLRHFSLKSDKAKLTGIFTSHSAGQPMALVDSTQAVIDKGLEGDRYYTNNGYWHRVEACQVTLISEQDLELAGRGNPLNFQNGQHRRNLVVGGIKTKSLKDKIFRIGEVVFHYDKNRPPCGYIDTIEGKGMALALGKNSGICIKVLKSGKLSIGDELEILKHGEF